MLSKLIDWLRTLARKRRWLIIAGLLTVVLSAWDVLVDAHTFSWLFEKLRLPTVGWLGAVATNHRVPLATLLIGFVWLAFWFFWPDKPAITNPRNRDVVNAPINVSGTHHNQTGNYWLVTNEGYNYWPKQRVNFRPDGRWDEQFDTDSGKKVTISLVKVSDLLDTTFENWKRNANKTKNWNALPLSQIITMENLVKVDSIVITVAPKP